MELQFNQLVAQTEKNYSNVVSSQSELTKKLKLMVDDKRKDTAILDKKLQEW